MKISTLLLLTFVLVANCGFAQKVFTSKTHRFSIREPDGWGKEINRPNYFALDVHSGENIVMFKKPRKSNEIDPTIDISIERTTSREANFFKKFSEEASKRESYYLAYTVVKQPEEIIIDGKKAVYTTVNFKYKGHGTQKTDYRKRIYFILWQKNVYKVVFINDAFIDDDEKLFDDLIKTIKIGA